MRNPVLVLFLAAILAVPAAAAAWGAKGDTEPNTALDAAGTYMYTGPNREAKNKVYFNGFGGMCMGAWAVCSSTSFNPNVGSLGTGVPVYPYQAYAMLGVWRDCNKDGYVGFGEQGLFEYRLTGNAAVDNAVWKVDTSICPVTPVPTNIPPNHPPAHNDGQWVREFLPIGWGPTVETWPTCKSATPNLCGDPNLYDFNDNGARVWADWGNPGDPPGNQCYARPHTRGTWHSVGGVQQWVDCYGQNRIDDTTHTHAQLRAAWVAVRGEDPNTATTECASSHFGGLPNSYRPGCNPWGEESQKSYVDAFECTGDGSGRTALPQKVAYIPAPKGSPGVNTDGSMAGTMNETNGDFVSNCRHNRAKPLPEGWAGPYSTESDLTNLNGVRDQHDMVMFYNAETRPAAPVGAYMALGRQTAGDAGLGTLRQAELWVGNSVTAASRNPYVDRATLGSTFSDVWSMTFYAHVSAEADTTYNLEVPSTVAGVYGSDACGTAIGAGQPDKKQWKCDPAKWWPKAAPWAVDPRTCNPETDNNCQRRMVGGQLIDAFVVPGQAYELRDTDCWDHSAKALRDEGVHYGVLSETACS